MDKIVQEMTWWERIVFFFSVLVIFLAGGIVITQEHQSDTLIAVSVIALFSLVGVLVKMLIRLNGEAGFIRGRNYEMSRETARKMGWE
ncbi:hypothetical protein HY625_01355 [Candidatus Uhrbacteria bacterium]|nr:hypothetical protein [Candidatus Uhrbacteria bacterium]